MKGLLSLRDVSMLYYYYQSSGFYDDFISYLEDNDAVKAVKFGDDEYNTSIITSDYEAKDFKIDGKVSLPCYQFGYCSKYVGGGNDYGKNLTLKADPDRNDVLHSEVIGSIFNISGGKGGAGATDDVKARTIQNANLAKAAFSLFCSAYVTRYDSVHIDYYSAQEITAGEFFKSCNVEGSAIQGTDTGSAFKNSTYTASTGYNYGALVIVPFPESENEETDSIFGNGNIALICGGAVILCAIGFGCGFAVGGKKKMKKEDK